MSYIAGHLQLKNDRNGYATVTRICKTCENTEHAFQFLVVLNKVLGFTSSVSAVAQQNATYVSQRPASLIGGTPNMMFVHTDIREPYITGVVHTPLLRVVPITITDNSNYGTGKIRNFLLPRYVASLHTSFQTITIDVRDELVS